MAGKAVIKFRGMLACLGRKLKPEEAKLMGLIYLGEENISDITTGIDVMDRITKRRKLQNCTEDLEQLKESLKSSGRSDLVDDVDLYVANNPFLPEHISESTAATTTGLQEKQSDFSNSTVSGGVAGKKPKNYITGGNSTMKRRRIETPEERQLEEATGDMTVDSTSDSSDEASTSDSSDEADMGDDGEETTDEDRKYMTLARECAKRSKDEQTKVGAVLVKNGEVIAEGWNRMPLGCEDRFTWESKEEKPLQDGKHLYVVYAIQAAVLDAYKRKHDPAHSTLYTTLYPSNVCAQCIREVEVDKVVYISDKFHKTKFMKAARKIMKGIKCRQYNEPVPKSLKVASAPVPVVSSCT